MESNSRSVYSKTLELEKQLRSLLRQDPQDKAIPSLRNRICETYKELILNDFEFSLSKEVEQNLWKIGFYKSIEEYRKAIRKFATATANIKKEHGHPAGMRNQLRNKCAEFRNFLARSMAFYTDLIQKLQAKYNLSLNGSVIYDPSLADSEEVVDGVIKRSGHKAYSSCHKCFIFLGDLTRYHRDLYGEPEATQTDWSLAEGYYRQALAIVPDSGNPHNQLAVVATYRDEDLEAVYRYFRSLAVKIPFSTANDNLRVLFDKNKDKLSKLLDPHGTQDKSRSGLMSRREKSTGPPDGYKLFALRYVRLHGILFTSTSLETFEELKGAMLTQLDDLLTQKALDANKLLRLLLINIFTFHRTLREGEDSVVHRNAYVLTLEVTTNIAAHTPYGDPHPPSPQLPHLSVFLDWALHHHSLLHPLVYSQETEAEGEPVCRQLGQALAPVLSSLIHSNLGEGELLPPTLAEEFDLAAFLPLSTTFALVPPPASASSHSHRIAKMKQAIASLIQIQPTWAYLQFDDSAKSFLPTDSIVEKPQMQSLHSQPSPRNGSPEYREEPMTSEDESIDLNPIEEDDDLRRVTGVSIDLSMIDEEPRPQSHGVAGGSISLNDDEVVDDDDVDEVILFNPFARPNNQLSVPIGGERLRTNTSESEQQNDTGDTNLRTADAPVSENATPPAKPALYVPPHRQGLDIRLHSHENGAAGREGRRHPPYAPRGSSSSSSLTPPRKTVAPPPGLPPRPPPGFSPIPSNTESLFSSAQGGDPFSSFFGLGSPIAPSHVSYPFSYRTPSSPSTSSTSPSIPSRPPPGFSSIQPQHQQTRLPPPGFSVPAPVNNTTTEEQSAITSIAWPFAPHRAQQQSEDRGAEQHQSGWGPWQTMPPRQWPTNSNWQTDPALKTSNPFLT